MKRGWKIFWIVCAALAGIGVVCCAASYALGVTMEKIADRYPDGIGFHETDHDSETSKTDSYESYEEALHAMEEAAEEDCDDDSKVETQSNGDGEIFTKIRSIDAQVSAGAVEVHEDPSLADGVRIVVKNVDKRLKLKYYKEAEDGELEITTVKRIHGLTGGHSVGKIELYVPEGYTFEDVSFDMTAGALYIENIHTEELSVEVGAGMAEIAGFRAKEADFDCGTGNIAATGISEDEVNIDCGIGEITYRTTGNETDYNYSLNCGVGDITCGENTYSGILKKKKVNNHAAKDMDIDCGIGEVTVTFAEQL